jgi:hypothetical protein
MNVPSDDEVSRLRERVAARPSDLQLRFALGELLLKRQDHAQAIAELQPAMNDLRLRKSAGKLIAEAFDARGMSEAAAAMRRLISGDDSGSDGSAPIPVPIAPRPSTLPDAAAAKEIPDNDENA